MPLFDDDTAGDFGRFTPAPSQPKDLTQTFSYKMLSALEKLKNKVGLPDSFDDAMGYKEGTIGESLGVAKSAVGRGVAALGKSITDTAKAALVPSVMDRESTFGRVAKRALDYETPAESFKSQSAGVGEDIELLGKEKKIRREVEDDVLNQNPSESAGSLKSEINTRIAERLLKDGIFTRRPNGAGAVFAQSVANGASYGVFDGYASEAIKLARMMKNPYTQTEKAAAIAGHLGGGLLAYGSMANKIGAGLKTVPALRAFAGKHWFLFNAGLQNLGEEAVDMTIRKATGQEYGKSDFLLGMGFGIGAETLFGAAKAFKNFNLSPVQKQLNKEVESFVHEFDRYPDFEIDLFPRIEKKYMAGTKMTYGEAFQAFRANAESRLVGLKGMEEGRPGIDFPSEPPELKGKDVGSFYLSERQAESAAKMARDRANDIERRIASAPTPARSRQLKNDLRFELKTAEQAEAELLKFRSAKTRIKPYVQPEGRELKQFRVVSEDPQFNDMDLDAWNGEISRWVTDDELKAIQETGTVDVTPKGQFKDGSDDGKKFWGIDADVGKSVVSRGQRMHRIVANVQDMPKMYMDPKMPGTALYVKEAIPVDKIRLAETIEPKDVNENLEPLLKEARKYKSAEEFVISIGNKHRPPDASYGSSLDDVTEMFGKDMYSDNALRYYGQGFEGDKEAVRIIQSMKGKPDAEIIVYRAVLPSEPKVINPGDWVTITESYAKRHGESVLSGMENGGFKIVKKKVQVKDLITDANSMQEWGYRPNGHKDMTKSELIDFWNKATSSKGFSRENVGLPIREIGENRLPGRTGDINLRMGTDGQPVRVDAMTESTSRAAGDVIGGNQTPPSAAKLLGQQPSPFQRLREKTLLRYKLNAEQRGARLGFFTGRRSVKEAQEDLVDYVRETLGPKDRGKVLSLLKNTQNEKSLKRAIAKVDQLVEQVNRREMIQDIKSVMRSDFLDKLPVSTRRQIVDKVSQFALSKPTDATRTLAEQVEEQIAAGTEEIAPALLRKAAEVRKTPLKDLDAEELRGLYGYVTDAVTRGKNSLLLKKIETAEDVGEAAKQIDAALDWWSKNGANKNGFLKALWFADLEYTTPDRFFDMLDGFKGYKGPIYNTFKVPVDEATSDFMRDYERVVREMSDEIDLNGVSKESMERIGTYGLWQRVDRDRFIGREKLRLRGIEEPPELTAKEMHVYEFMRKKFDEIYPKVAKTLEDSENRDLGAGVVNYWPMITDRNSDKSIRDIVRENSFNLKRDAAAGFTQKAVGGEQIVELNAAKVFQQHVEDALYFVHMQPVLDRLNAIVDYRIPDALEGAGQQLVKERLGNQGTEYVMRYLNTVATNGAAGGVNSGWAQALRTIRNNTSLATMGGNIGTTIKQPLSLLNAAAYVGPHKLLNSMMRVGSVPFEDYNGTIKFIMDNSAELRSRNAGEYALYELTRDGTWLEKLPVVGKGAEGFRKMSFYLLKKLDAMAAMSVWDATYRDAAKSMDFDDAVALADRTVRLTQSSGLAKDLPFVMQRGETARVLHQFQSFAINDWNLIKHDIIRSGLMRGGGEKTLSKQWGRRVQAMSAAMFMLLASQIDDLITAGGDWEKAKEGGLLWGVAEKVPLLGRAISFSRFGGTTVPAVDTVLRGASAGIKLATEDMTDNEREKQMIELGKSAGGLFGIPGTGQFAKQLRANRTARMESEKGGGGFDSANFDAFGGGDFGAGANFNSFGSF